MRHDQQEPSAVSAHDEDETDAGVRRPARQEARIYHQLRLKSAIGAPPRPSINMTRMDAKVLQTFAQTEERTAPRRLDDFERDLQRELEEHLDGRQFPFLVRDRDVTLKGTASARCLRGAVCSFFRHSKRCDELSLQHVVTRLSLHSRPLSRSLGQMSPHRSKKGLLVGRPAICVKASLTV